MKCDLLPFFLTHRKQNSREDVFQWVTHLVFNEVEQFYVFGERPCENIHCVLFKTVSVEYKDCQLEPLAVIIISLYSQPLKEASDKTSITLNHTTAHPRCPAEEEQSQAARRPPSDLAYTCKGQEYVAHQQLFTLYKRVSPGSPEMSLPSPPPPPPQPAYSPVAKHIAKEKVGDNSQKWELNMRWGGGVFAFCRCQNRTREVLVRETVGPCLPYNCFTK